MDPEERLQDLQDAGVIDCHGTLVSGEHFATQDLGTRPMIRSTARLLILAIEAWWEPVAE